MKKQILIIATALAITGGAIGYVSISKDEAKQFAPSAQNAAAEQPPISEVSYEGIDGKNALELLKQSHKVETKSYEGIGELVTSIDGVTPDSKHFWALYINGQQSQVGAEAYIAKSTDTITWKLEEIK